MWNPLLQASQSNTIAGSFLDPRIRHCTIHSHKCLLIHFGICEISKVHSMGNVWWWCLNHWPYTCVCISYTILLTFFSEITYNNNNLKWQHMSIMRELFFEFPNAHSEEKKTQVRPHILLSIRQNILTLQPFLEHSH